MVRVLTLVLTLMLALVGATGKPYGSDVIVALPFFYAAVRGKRVLEEPGLSFFAKLTIALWPTFSRLAAAGDLYDFYHYDEVVRRHDKGREPLPKYDKAAVGCFYVLASLVYCLVWRWVSRPSSKRDDGDQFWILIYTGLFCVSAALTFKAGAGIRVRGLSLSSGLYAAVTVTAMLVSASVFFFRERLFAFMSAKFEGEQSLGDGMFIAALLDTTNGRVKKGDTYWVHYDDFEKREERRDPHPESDKDKDISPWLQKDQREHFKQGVVTDVHPQELMVQFGVISSGSRKGSIGRKGSVTCPPPEPIEFKSTMIESDKAGEDGKGGFRSDSTFSNVVPVEDGGDDQEGNLASGSWRSWCCSNGKGNPDQRLVASGMQRSDTELSNPPFSSPPESNEAILMQKAKEQLRCVHWDKIKRSLFTTSPREMAVEKQTEYKKELFALSHPVPKNKQTGEPEKIDFFVSHSWNDDGHAKYKQLANVAEDFKRHNGRDPTFWLDAVCFDQVILVVRL